MAEKKLSAVLVLIETEEGVNQRDTDQACISMVHQNIQNGAGGWYLDATNHAGEQFHGRVVRITSLDIALRTGLLEFTPRIGR